jgi:DNA-binding MarR family transcriptional regulator
MQANNCSQKRLTARRWVHMHTTMTDKTLALSPLPCACANMRRATRAITQLYDAALRSMGLRITQFTLLQVLERTGEPMTQAALSDFLALDSTTLSRTLRPLEQAKWIRRVEGGDARERRIELAPLGRRVLERATPAWARVQRRLRTDLDQRDWAALQALLMAALTAARRVSRNKS